MVTNPMDFYKTSEENAETTDSADTSANDNADVEEFFDDEEENN